MPGSGIDELVIHEIIKLDLTGVDCNNATGKKKVQPMIIQTQNIPQMLEERKTSNAYDVARRACYGALPNCRGCACLAIDQIVLTRLKERNAQ
jgi:hypothetical protein